MSNEPHFYEPANGHGLPHDPFNAIVGPRPIGWIASRSGAGVLNLAPYSFFNGFNYTPPIIGFSSIGHKDSVTNVKETGEFVWNLATRPLAEAMNRSCATAPPEVDEFVLAGLTPEPGRIVNVPRVAESPVNFECKVTEIIQIKSHTGVPAQSWLILGEVVAVHIDRKLLKDGIFETFHAKIILRGGGPSAYAEIRPDCRFDMIRPK